MLMGLDSESWYQHLRLDQDRFCCLQHMDIEVSTSMAAMLIDDVDSCDAGLVSQTPASLTSPVLPILGRCTDCQLDNKAGVWMQNMFVGP